MISEEHRQLMAHALTGELSAEQARLLLSECRRQPALLREFSRWATTERLLAYLHVYGDKETFVREVRQRLLEAEAPSNRIVWAPPWWQPMAVWTTAMAALLVLLAGLATFLLGKSGPESEVTVVRTEAVSGLAGQPILERGKPLPVRRVQIESGLLELQFKSGAAVILEGPADFEVASALECVLRRGKVVARVPESARGFAVDGPRGRMVDLGTEFGVTVTDTGDTEVHVLDGHVEATPNGQKAPLKLVANQALRLTSSATEPMPVDVTAFVTEMPPNILGPIGFVHWSFDEAQGKASLNTGERLGRPKAPARLLSFGNVGDGPKWVPGQFGHGLSLDGQSDFVECDFVGIGGNQPRTAAFWVKVPRDIQTNQSDAIINWGTDARQGAIWRVSINNNADLNSSWGGPMGRLRVGVHGGYVVGTTDLRDDHWHHCAVVMYGGERPNMGSHVLIYIDGELEQAARKKVFEISTDVQHATAHNIWIGRNLSYREPGQVVTGGAPFFRGCVDEVFIFNVALPQEQIVSLMKYNRLQRMPLIASNNAR